MHTCDLLVHASHILTNDCHGTQLENASLAVDKGIIAAMGPRESLESQWQGARTLDLGQALIFPGLINAHTHAAMTFLRGLADDLPLLEWLHQHIFPVEQHLTPEIVECCTLLGHAEMLRTGVTGCMDMYLMEEAVFRAARRSGIRCLGGEVVFNFPGAGSPGGMATLDIVRQQAADWKNDTRIGVLVCPHAVYTTTPELLIACRDLAEELGLPLHLHLAESAAETAQCLEMWGKRPIPYCHDLGLLRPGCSLAHVVDTTDEELDLLGACGVSVVHNPSSNMKLASGAASVAAMLERGIPVALGTDGAASNNRLNMFTEMGRAALMHKLVQQDPTVVPAKRVLHMATTAGAIVMGNTSLGQLSVGHSADFGALDLAAPNLQPLYNAVSHMVYAATGMENRLTVVEGEILWQDGEFTRFDYKALCREMEDIRRWVLQKLPRPGK